ncbi:hypothetical protein H112_03968 [Trichophyton rubrum D6]|uniref:Uncharacterized protein n=4 Tax=Trichophyton TaxID=5550 RepID=A0A178EXL8_TRIRU|nr:uncharacterized protein TERG_05292 [Trichophyton rubrum CBS 118892]EZF23244.1 hypothetical protein H100_03975 [Trichophyton rubrum MR850]EZF42383.1 hypothetical protein H102_03961 [Trichophyton rubrum CBS 100081]EZF53048.1 hypothetical protein H103_03975 [Trichophyton rubrum CBS 288.86]EZF63687.1 hypothetical protein H104_03961 [Trichophyton rubrum CBS 289.86]EZF74291.1 hypothetical protein H105_03989 [Trichophyton soudanense CBS 452.61]EZF84966.1 hypothetical protein H110_03968 [Trichophy
MWFSKGPVLLAICSLLSTSVFAADRAPSVSSPTPAIRQRSDEVHDNPPLPSDSIIKERAIVDAPPDPVPTVPTQVSPITTFWLDGVQKVYTQTFPPFPDPWPSPMVGQIGLGTLKGEIGKTVTIKGRSVPTDEPEPMFARQCRTLECGKSREQKAERAAGLEDTA